MTYTEDNVDRFNFVPYTYQNYTRRQTALNLPQGNLTWITLEIFLFQERRMKMNNYSSLEHNIIYMRPSQMKLTETFFFTAKLNCQKLTFLVFICDHIQGESDHAVNVVQINKQTLETQRVYNQLSFCA
jgi:hypothetical protein